jgi:HSP20 family protein
MFLIHRPTETMSGLNRLFDEAFSRWQLFGPQDGSLVGSWIPACDVLEEADAVKIVAELPGVRPDDVQISVEDGVLTVRGQKRQRAEERTERVHRYERTYGLFERSFRVPETVDADSIRATYENGVLTIALPKVERAKPRQIQVEVRQG